MATLKNIGAPPPIIMVVFQSSMESLRLIFNKCAWWFQLQVNAQSNMSKIPGEFLIGFEAAGGTIYRLGGWKNKHFIDASKPMRSLGCEAFGNNMVKFN